MISDFDPKFSFEYLDYSTLELNHNKLLTLNPLIMFPTETLSLQHLIPSQNTPSLILLQHPTKDQVENNSDPPPIHFSNYFIHTVPPESKPENQNQLFIELEEDLNNIETQIDFQLEDDDLYILCPFPDDTKEESAQSFTAYKRVDKKIHPVSTSFPSDCHVT